MSEDVSRVGRALFGVWIAPENRNAQEEIG